MFKNSQKGISLTITFFFMTIIVVAAASIGTVLYKEVKITNAVTDSEVASTAADTGVESAKWYATAREGGICNTCNTCTGLDASISCASCTAIGSDCNPASCSSCQITYSSVPVANKTYTATATVVSGQPTVIDSSGNYNSVSQQAEGVVYSGIIWSTPAGGPTSKNYMAVASDSSGQHQIVGAFGGRLYLSSDFGSSWQETQPAGNTNADWLSVASGSDGSHLMAAGTPASAPPTPAVYLSSNSGQTWQAVQPAGNGNTQPWQKVASGADGKHLFAGSLQGGLYVSKNSGNTWALANSGIITSGNWGALACSLTGQYVIAGNSGGNLYISSDYGQSWTAITLTVIMNGFQFHQPWTAQWSGATINDSGVAAVAIYGGQVYVSPDAGANWTAQTFPAPIAGNNENWTALAASSDATKIIALINGGDIYTTTNGGTSWLKNQPAGASPQFWKAAASNASGSQFVAVINGGNIYEGASH